ncbi:hypothetical protein DHOM_11120 [Dermabacter hominis 1368]|uniref:Uncharacterized protein n=1 Tax=Dermabacter hominis 1368 TaxID=1450519 RepID=A0ABR4SHB6_9MICO|nr:hypothetical protein DHOM_11120 [Dermabacter hominis 1368]
MEKGIPVEVFFSNDVEASYQFDSLTSFLAAH